MVVVVVVRVVMMMVVMGSAGGEGDEEKNEEDRIIDFLDRSLFHGLLQLWSRRPHTISTNTKKPTTRIAQERTLGRDLPLADEVYLVGHQEDGAVGAVIHAEVAN